MTRVTEATLWELLNTRFHGILLRGSHKESSNACALELLSVAQHQGWTDDPTTLRTFDLRPLNDMAVGNTLRTRYLLPLLAQYASSVDWAVDKQQTVLTQLILSTVNRLIAELPQLPPAMAQGCREATTLEEAGRAARAAGEALGTANWAAAWAAAWAAEAAAKAAAKAAAPAAKAAARAAAIKRIFITTCQFWLEASHVA